MSIYGAGYIGVNLVGRAGGINIFADQPKAFLDVSAEQVATLDPEVIIINDYPGGMTAQQKYDDLVATFPNASAVKHDRIVTVPYQLLNPSIRGAEGVRALAEAFHPDAF